MSKAKEAVVQRDLSAEISSRVRYHKLNKAAEILGCHADELLHLAAMGQLEILAPLAAAGEFIWPYGEVATAFIDLDEPFVRYFDASSRVALFPDDLATIEAMGWAVPWRFRAPEFARTLIKEAPRDFEVCLAARRAESMARNARVDAAFAALIGAANGSSSVDDIAKHLPAPTSDDLDASDDALRKWRDSGFHSAWVRAHQVDEDASRTTIDHLFISIDEISRIRNGRLEACPLSAPPQRDSPPKPPHLNTEHNAQRRLDVLIAAIWVHRDAIKEIVSNAREWARLIDLAAPDMWESGKPSLEPRTIDDLLRMVLNGKGVEKLRSKSPAKEK